MRQWTASAVGGLVALCIFISSGHSLGRGRAPNPNQTTPPAALPVESRDELSKEIQETLSLASEAIERLDAVATMERPTDRTSRTGALQSWFEDLVKRHEELESADAAAYVDAQAAAVRALERLQAVYWPVVAEMPELREAEMQVARRRVDRVMEMTRAARRAPAESGAARILPGLQSRLERAQKDLERLQLAEEDQWVHLRKRLYQRVSEARVLFWSTFDTLPSSGQI